MLISLIMQIAQSMQISIRHFLNPQTMHITFPLKNLAVKNISGLTHCRYSSGKWTNPFPVGWAHPVSLVLCFSILSLLAGLILFHWFFVSPSFPCWLGSSCFTGSLFLHPFPAGWAHPVSLVLCFSILSLLTGLILFHWFFVSPSFPC